MANVAPTAAGSGAPDGIGRFSGTDLQIPEAIFPVETPCQPRQRVGASPGYPQARGIPVRKLHTDKYSP
jgi:hypothetical protein